MVRIVAAEVRASVLDHEPPLPLALARIGETEVDDHAAGAWELLQAHEAADVPHEEAGVQLRALQAAPDPARAPVPEREHDRAQLLRGRRRVVLDACIDLPPLDDPHLLQLLQPRGEQRRRHARNAPAQVVEAAAAAEQLAHDERRPALAEDLRASRDRAELTVVDHALKPTGTAIAARSRFWT